MAGTLGGLLPLPSLLPGSEPTVTGAICASWLLSRGAAPMDTDASTGVMLVGPCWPADALPSVRASSVPAICNAACRSCSIARRACSAPPWGSRGAGACGGSPSEDEVRCVCRAATRRRSARRRSLSSSASASSAASSMVVARLGGARRAVVSGFGRPVGVLHRCKWPSCCTLGL